MRKLERVEAGSEDAENEQLDQKMQLIRREQRGYSKERKK